MGSSQNPASGDPRLTPSALELGVTRLGIEWKMGQKPKIGKVGLKSAKRSSVSLSPKCQSHGGKIGKNGVWGHSVFFAIFGPLFPRVLSFTDASFVKAKLTRLEPPWPSMVDKLVQGQATKVEEALS